MIQSKKSRRTTRWHKLGQTMLIHPKIETRGRTRGRPGERAFTLAEVILAMGIGGVVFVTLYLGLARGFNSVESANLQLRATQILAETIEVSRVATWTQVTNGFLPQTFTAFEVPGTNNGTGSGTVFRGTVTVGNVTGVSAAYANTMRRITVGLTWVNGGITNQETMQTLVSYYGMQNYLN
jgi:uncharacterized protein (TIGR02598 family)